MTLSLTWSHSSYSEQADRDLFEDASVGIAGVLKPSHSLFLFTALFQEVDIVLSTHFDIPVLQASSTLQPSISWPGSFPLQLHCPEHSCPSVLSLLIMPSELLKKEAHTHKKRAIRKRNLGTGKGGYNIRHKKANDSPRGLYTL